MTEFVVHPARAQPAKTAAVLLYVGLAAWTMGGLAPFGTWIVIGASAWILRGWFLPTRYRIDEHGIEVRSLALRVYPWTRFRGWRRERSGFYLSPFSDVGRFDNFRGLFIFLDNFVVFFSHGDGPTSPAENLQALLEEHIGGHSAPGNG